MIISVGAEKAFATSIYDGLLSKVGMERMYLCIKRPYMTTSQLISYSMVKIKKHFYNSNKTHLPFLFNIVLEVLPRAIRQEKKNESHHPNYKRKVKLSLLVDGMILYIEN